MELDSFQQDEFENHWGNTTALWGARTVLVNSLDRASMTVHGHLLSHEGAVRAVTIPIAELNPPDFESGFYDLGASYNSQLAILSRNPQQTTKRGACQQNMLIMNVMLDNSNIRASARDFHYNYLGLFWKQHTAPDKLTGDHMLNMLNRSTIGDRATCALGRNYAIIHTTARTADRSFVGRLVVISPSGVVGIVTAQDRVEISKKLSYLTPSLEEELANRFSSKVEIHVRG